MLPSAPRAAPLPTPGSSCSCRRYKILLPVPPDGSVHRKRGVSPLPFLRQSPTASNSAVESPDSPPVPPADRTEHRFRTATTRSSPPPSRRISSRPHPPALPLRKHPRTDCSAAVPTRRPLPRSAPAQSHGCAGRDPSVCRPYPLNSAGSDPLQSTRRAEPGYDGLCDMPQRCYGHGRVWAPRLHLPAEKNCFSQFYPCPPAPELCSSSL